MSSVLRKSFQEIYSTLSGVQLTGTELNEEVWYCSGGGTDSVCERSRSRGEGELEGETFEGGEKSAWLGVGTA